MKNIRLVDFSHNNKKMTRPLLLHWSSSSVHCSSFLRRQWRQVFFFNNFFIYFFSSNMRFNIKTHIRASNVYRILFVSFLCVVRARAHARVCTYACGRTIPRDGFLTSYTRDNRGQRFARVYVKRDKRGFFFFFFYLFFVESPLVTKL